MKWYSNDSVEGENKVYDDVDKSSITFCIGPPLLVQIIINDKKVDRVRVRILYKACPSLMHS